MSNEHVKKLQVVDLGNEAAEGALEPVALFNPDGTPLSVGAPSGGGGAVTKSALLYKGEVTPTGNANPLSLPYGMIPLSEDDAVYDEIGLSYVDGNLKLPLGSYMLQMSIDTITQLELAAPEALRIGFTIVRYRFNPDPMSLEPLDHFTKQVFKSTHYGYVTGWTASCLVIGGQNLGPLAPDYDGIGTLVSVKAAVVNDQGAVSDLNAAGTEVSIVKLS